MVPLAGKSLDVKYLHSLGYHVVAVEAVEIAVEAFFEEAGLTPTIDRDSAPYPIYRASQLEYHVTNFFELGPSQLPDLSCAYDRGAIVAIEPQLRKSYAQRLIELMPVGASILMVTLEYPAGEMDGPPYAIDVAKVSNFFGQAFSIEEVEVDSILEAEPRLKGRGLSFLNERVFKLVRL